MSRTSLDHVSNEEFIKIVQEMKPEIGDWGGRKFVRGKDSYTMNQITKRYQKTKGSVELDNIIYDKDRQATEMLKNASCLQKWLTKIKQNWGNSRFKNENPIFIGKEAILQSIQAMRQQKPMPIVLPPIFEPPIALLPTVRKEPDLALVKVEPKVEEKKEAVDLKEAFEEIPSDERYLEIANNYLKERNLDKAKEVLYAMDDEKSESAQRLHVNIGMFYIDQLNDKKELDSLNYNKWLQNASLNRKLNRFTIVRDASIVAAKILWKQEQRGTALQVLSSLAFESHSNDATDLRNYLANGGKDFDRALQIAMRIKE